MTATLTDRYIAETLRGIRYENHDDIRRELSASIVDAVEARIEHGQAPDDAERAALEELGDPARLAASLEDRPLQLIGPRYYLTWLRLLKLLLWIAPVCVAALATIEPVTRGEGVGSIIAEAFAGGVTAALHVFFWTTLGFAITERVAAAAESVAARGTAPGTASGRLGGPGGSDQAPTQGTASGGRASGPGASSAASGGRSTVPSAPSAPPGGRPATPSTPAAAPGGLSPAPSAPSARPGGPSAAPSAPSVAPDGPSPAPSAPSAPPGGRPATPSAPSRPPSAPSRPPSGPSPAPGAPSADTGGRERPASADHRAWTVDRLPTGTTSRQRLADVIATAIALGLIVLGFVWDRFPAWVILDGESIPVFSPALWPWWMAGLFAIFAMTIAFQVVLYVRGRWTTSLAIANTALNVLGLSWYLTLLGRGELFNPRLIEVITERGDLGDDATVFAVVAVVLGFGGAAIAAGGIADGWVKRAKDARAG